MDQKVVEFKSLCSGLNISHDDFIRTTERRHIRECQQLWRILQKKGKIYFDEYSGQYCYDCENFYTQSQAPDGNCPHHNKPLEEKKEKGYFFKMSEYQSWLIDHFKRNPQFISPEKARREVLSRLEGEKLRDLPISRPNEEGWGVEVPEDKAFVMYTWFDAVINYYSALSCEQKGQFWPADCHVIGKDIVWFHAVIWPALLKASDLAIPLKVYVHGMVLAEDGQKMSKSLGNTVNPQAIMERYPIESFRYYMLRAISAGGDGRFSEKDLWERHCSELGNDLGNLVFRVIKFSLKRGLSSLAPKEAKQELFFTEMARQFADHVEKYEHNRALDVLWASIRGANQYLNQTEPWKFKDNPERLHEILYNCLYALHIFCFYLTPVMPEIANKICQFMGITLKQNPVGCFARTSYQLHPPEILFAKEL